MMYDAVGYCSRKELQTPKFKYASITKAKRAMSRDDVSELPEKGG